MILLRSTRAFWHSAATDRFEFFIAGQAITNGLSELNDPEDQAEHLRRQAEEKEAGHEAAINYDVDYVLALEYGLPLTAGERIGIKRIPHPVQIPEPTALPLALVHPRRQNAPKLGASSRRIAR